jgi:ABC-type nitrate/sulfonate/bicarbonate transport system ATPase subunit
MIEIVKVSRTYTDDYGAKTEVFSNLSLTVEKGELLSLIGPSGCGKTTLLRLIAGLDLPQAGAVFIDNTLIEAPGVERGYVFQQPSLFPWKTVAENIATGLRISHCPKAHRESVVAHYLELMGLSGFAEVYPHALSGGMAQRAALARALVNEPEVLLLDEPLGALDAFTRIELQDVILKMQKMTGTTIVLVTHDVDEAVYLSDRIAVMSARPGAVSDVIAVGFKGTRDRNDDDFVALRRRVLEKLHLAGSVFRDVAYPGEAI